MQKKGFTLIELLTSIFIISILVSLSAFGIQNARESARDTKREADMGRIRAGLSRYNADCGTYPGSLPASGDALTGGSAYAPSGVGVNPACDTNNVYIDNFPADPDPNNSYYYETEPTGSVQKTSYLLCAALTDPPDLGANPDPNPSDCGSCGAVACNVAYRN